MYRSLFLAGFAVLLATTSVQSQQPSARPSTVTNPSDTPLLAGKWTYRSFHNDPVPVADDPKTAAEKALALIFAEAVFTFEIPTSTTLKGSIDWAGGGLDLQGNVGTNTAGAAPTVEIVGTGRSGTSTAGWEYDYRGQLAYQWPNGVNQVLALVGTVIRAKPHGGAPAGYVASFIAVKRP
ncbi:MAG TPA: hypothetical protein VFP43_21925 [Mesorhizobium sp.]|nr:hypothetical protein [Mesorhizobium sp.]